MPVEQLKWKFFYAGEVDFTDGNRLVSCLMVQSAMQQSFPFIILDVLHNLCLQG
jgi:hypothetical protein